MAIRHQFVRRAAAWVLLLSLTLPAQTPTPAPTQITGFKDAAAQLKWEQQFIAVPDPKRADEAMKMLTSVPHIAGSPEGKRMAEYVAQKFRAAGLDTELVEYRVWMNYPQSISVKVTAPATVKMNGPSREQVVGDPFQNDKRVLTAFNGFSPSGEVEAEVVYANYGRLEDFKKLEELKVDVKGKIVVVRYGQNFRGVKSYVAEQRGAAGVIIYSDPMDDGYFKGDKYPNGPWRPDSGVQRGSILYMFKYPGDPTSPGKASLPGLAESERTPPEKAASMPRILTTPLSYLDARPILENLRGPAVPKSWQGALPFTYHLGPGPVKVKLSLKQDYQYRSVWNVIGKIKGSEYPDEWVVAGNHRDPWIYGAVDPTSGTVAMLEAARGLGELLKAGWKPKRTIVLGSWDAEEQGLIGSTEWVEQHEKELRNAVAYFNVDVAVSGPDFGASAMPSLKNFLFEIAKAVPSARGGTIYDIWGEELAPEKPSDGDNRSEKAGQQGPAGPKDKRIVGDLGSGSDYTPFAQHAGVPSTDIGSDGPYGVYHSVFDNYKWYSEQGDPGFKYSQQMARFYGVQIMRMASADVLPFDYAQYGRDITGYIKKAQSRAKRSFKDLPDEAFESALKAAERFTEAGEEIGRAQKSATGDLARLNRTLNQAERGLLLPKGLPGRPFFRHSIYAPGEYTGYAAVVIPGVNEAIDANDKARMLEQLGELTAALERAAKGLESYR